jgi:hypothetical protein
VVNSVGSAISIGPSLGRSQQTYVDSSFSYTSVRQALINEGAAGASTLPVSNPSTRVLALRLQAVRKPPGRRTRRHKYQQNGHVFPRRRLRKRPAERHGWVLSAR